MNSSQEKNNHSRSSEFTENINILRQLAFFSELPLDFLKVLAYLCTREHFKQGESIFSQGEDDGCAYYIISGKATLSRRTNDDDCTIRECTAGDFFGGMTMAGKLDRLFSLTAEEETVCMVLPREKFGKTVEQFPELMPKILQALVSSIASWEENFLNEHNNCSACRSGLGASLA